MKSIRQDEMRAVTMLPSFALAFVPSPAGPQVLYILSWMYLGDIFLKTLHSADLFLVSGTRWVESVQVAGHRGYFLTGPGVLLNQALINYGPLEALAVCFHVDVHVFSPFVGLAFLSQRGYTPLQPPFFMKKDLMAKTAELEDYDDVLYKVIEDKENSIENSSLSSS